MTSEVSMDSPSAQRNKGPIWSVLSTDVLPPLKATTETTTRRPTLRVLELAAGCGVHTTHLVSEMTERGVPVLWYPTDPDATSRRGAEERLQKAPPDIRSRVRPPASLSLNADGFAEDADEMLARWREDDDSDDGLFDLMMCVNMIHISPWAATIGLFRTAKEHLRPDGILYCYGPFKIGGTAVESNLSFDRSLRSRERDWGVRDLEGVVELAGEQGFRLTKKIEMPANNLSLIFAKV